uniref:undecaprenyl-diphosphate phosphatase n=1 Tax=Cephaloticoccus sp. TaxID=1985742 RepID=UPI00404B9866
MRNILLFIIGVGLSLPLLALEPSSSAKADPVAELKISDAIIFGVVEGITEFLPISSTGHLIIATHVLGLDAEVPLTNKQGNPLWHKKPTIKNPAGEPLTLKLAADTYTVVIQVGAILAVVTLYWTQLINMLNGLLGRDSNGARLLRNVIYAFVPVAIVGLSTSGLIEKHLFSVGTVIIGLVGGAILMIFVERRRWRHASIIDGHKDAADLYPTEALKIGLIQCLALWPGTSRSMVTIVGGYLAGLSPAKSAEFSFLVGLPVLIGAAVVKGWRSGPAMIEIFGLSNVLLGIVVASISSVLAIKFLVNFLTRHGLFTFAIYRILLAMFITAYFYL